MHGKLISYPTAFTAVQIPGVGIVLVHGKPISYPTASATVQIAGAGIVLVHGKSISCSTAWAAVQIIDAGVFWDAGFLFYGFAVVAHVILGLELGIPLSPIMH